MSAERFLKVAKPWTVLPPEPMRDNKLTVWEEFMYESACREIRQVDPGKLRAALALAFLRLIRLQSYAVLASGALENPDPRMVDQVREAQERISEMVTMFIHGFRGMLVAKEKANATD
jgi:hypothetical protein